LFVRLDANKDGMITQAEADAARNAQAKGKKPGQPNAGGGLFARLDSNKDKVVTRAEFDAAAAQMQARLEKAGAADRPNRLLQAADANKDGRVTLAEVQQIALQHFDRADLNHDNKLTPEERRQTRQQAKTPRKPS
jgi:hypothetical protein